MQYVIALTCVFVLLGCGGKTKTDPSTLMGLWRCENDESPEADNILFLNVDFSVRIGYHVNNESIWKLAANWTI